MSAALANRIYDALRVVIDPELGCNIVDLGLIYALEIGEGGVVTLTMTTTTRGCPATDYLKTGARDAAWSVEGVEFVDVVMTYAPAWSVERMSQSARNELAMGASR